MARLTRITGKIFGETATSTGDDPQIGQFGSALAGTYVGTTNVATIQSLPAWSNGFIDAVTPSNQYPPLPEMTGFGKVLSYQQNYLLQQGIPEWDSATTYYINNFCSLNGRLFISLTDSNLNNNPTEDLVNWKEYQFGGSGHLIGEVVTSVLPLNDSGLHLLDGTLIQGTGIYTAFVNYIATLYGDGTNVPTYFTSEANWQSTVATYGSCGKFVYDSVNNTVRLPKISNILEGTTDVSALGSLIEAGLPNIEGGEMEYGDDTAKQTMPPYEYLGIRGYEEGSASGRQPIFKFNASLVNSIYGNSNTVQPQTIKVLYYIVVSTSTKTEIEVDIDDIATDLNGKADVDLSNTSPSQSFKNNVISWGIPDYANGISVSSSTLTYTAPAQGFIYFSLYGGTGGYLFPIKINNVEVPSSLNTASGEYRNTFSYLVDKNDVITWGLALTAAVSIAFYPLKGAN